MSEDLQRGELKTKRRALRETRLQLARFGIGAPVHLIIQEQDLAKEVRAIERELGIEQTPTIRERGIGPPAPRYTEPDFQERMDTQQAKQRQKDIEHQLGLLGIHRRNLAHYQQQAKRFGGVDLAPPITRSGIEEGRGNIARIKDILRSYGIEVEDLAGDE